MKKTIFMLVAVTVSAIFVSANPSLTTVTFSAAHKVVNAAPPQAVLSAFAINFGNAPVRQWKLRSNGNWRAHFTLNGVAWEATFTPAGVLVKSEAA